MEFLLQITLEVPPGTAQEEVDDRVRAEAVRAAELADAGHLQRLWRPEGPGWRNIGLWQASDLGQLHKLLESLPLHPWMTIEIRVLGPHPNDPGVRP